MMNIAMNNIKIWIENCPLREEYFWSEVIYNFDMMESSNDDKDRLRHLSYLNKWVERNYNQKWVFERKQYILITEEQYCKIIFTNHALDRIKTRRGDSALIYKIKSFLLKSIKKNKIEHKEEVIYVVTIDDKKYSFVIMPLYEDYFLKNICIITFIGVGERSKSSKQSRVVKLNIKTIIH